MIYAISDLHGHYDLYQKMLKEIDFKDGDTLYVLGDVIDRGPNPFEILFDMMKRPNVRPILGNHDLRMLTAIESTYFNSLEEAERFRIHNQVIDDWLYDRGAITISEYCKLNEEEKDKVKKYIKTFDLYKTLKVGDNSFFLAHTVPDTQEMKHYKDIPKEDFVWGEPEYDKRYFKNAYVVTGHTPTALISRAKRGEIYKNNGHIAIDCGAFFTGILGCICLNNLKEYYVSHEVKYE